MQRQLILGAALVGAGVVIGAYGVADRRVAGDPAASTGASTARPTRGVTEARHSAFSRSSPDPSVWQRRLDAIGATVEAETAARERVERRIDELANELATLRAGIEGSAAMANAPRADTSASSAPPAPQADAGAPQDEETQLSAIERALIAAGLDPGEAARIKSHEDAVMLADIYLRDQATREGWVDSPRFAEEKEALDRQRLSMREEIGDDAYDRYLAALGRPNRVKVEDVMLESPAARAGLQPGDLVLRYGGIRIFAPDDLVTETRGGVAGETIQVEVLRQGQRLEVAVPRGPLGIHIAATQANPDEG